MDKRRRLLQIALWSALALVVLAGVLGVFWYTQIRRPNRLMADMDWMTSASPGEQLAVAHKILRWGGNVHDASLLVGRHGGPGSVSYLMAALRRMTHTGPNGVMVCTKAYCLDALRRIAGQNCGDNYEDWIGWWEKNRGNPGYR
jgi:hypothetical protein